MHLGRLPQRLQLLLNQQHTDTHKFNELSVHIFELFGAAGPRFRLRERGEVADELARILRDGAAFADAGAPAKSRHPSQEPRYGTG